MKNPIGRHAILIEEHTEELKKRERAAFIKGWNAHRDWSPSNPCDNSYDPAEKEADCIFGALNGISHS